MKRSMIGPATALLSLALLAAAPVPAHAQTKAPPQRNYKKVSAITSLPDFLPGLGTLYVDPATLPEGPFLAYDHHGNLVSTIYMVPIADMDGHKDWSDLKVAQGRRVDHVDIMYNAGHPGVTQPHYHVILWYISRARADALK